MQVDCIHLSKELHILRISNSFPSSAEVKSGWSYKLLILLNGMDRKNLCFYYADICTDLSTKSQNFAKLQQMTDP